jgi:tripartite-type tricarboxylate transporter receptor subunit TctC
MPAPIVARLNRDIAQAVNSSEMRPKLDELKMSSITGTPEEAASFLRFTIESYAKIAKAAGIQPE